MIDLTYYQRNKDVIINRAKNYYENDKKRLRELARDKYRNYLKKIRIKRVNEEETDTTICLNKRNKD